MNDTIEQFIDLLETQRNNHGLPPLEKASKDQLKEVHEAALELWNQNDLPADYYEIIGAMNGFSFNDLDFFGADNKRSFDPGCGSPIIYTNLLQQQRMPEMKEFQIFATSSLWVYMKDLQQDQFIAVNLETDQVDAKFATFDELMVAILQDATGTIDAEAGLAQLELEMETVE